MAIQRPITLPPYTPSAWELRLPSYPVITNKSRSSAFPELLGSLPNGAEWALTFENQSSAEALELLLPWRATGCGQWALTMLPAELAGGVDSADFRKRLTGTTWSIAKEPRKEPVKNGRFNVQIELVHELTFSSLYGPTSSTLSRPNSDVLALNISQTLAVIALPTQWYRAPMNILGPILALNVSSQLSVAASAPSKGIKKFNAEDVLALAITGTLNPLAAVLSRQKKQQQFSAQAVLSIGISNTLAAMEPPTLAPRETLSMAAQAVLPLGLPSGLTVASPGGALTQAPRETDAETLLSLALQSLDLPGGLEVAEVNPAGPGFSAGPIISLGTSSDLSPLYASALFTKRTLDGNVVSGLINLGVSGSLSIAAVMP